LWWDGEEFYYLDCLLVAAIEIRDERSGLASSL